jgi:CheY-like chemotaxis protein
MHVLYVEDDEVLTQIVERALCDAGHTCETTNEGARALSLVKTNDYDAVALDVGLPDMDGCQVVRMMKVEGIATPVMLLSGLPDINLHFVAADLGVKKFLTKPFSASELIGHLEEIAGPGGAGRQVASPEPAPAPAPRPAPPPGTRQTVTPATGESAERPQARSAAHDAALILDGGRQISCTVLDRSEAGVALRLSDPAETCPEQFTLKFLDGPRHRCQVTSRDGGKIEVAFR